MASAKFQHNLMSLQSNMLNFAYMLTSNRDDAYNLLQSATLNALVNEDKYAEGTNFKGWIFTIMRNIFVNDFKQSAHDTLGYRLNISLEATAEEPEDCHSENEITDAINGLEEHMQVIMSMHVTGYTCAEIAGYTGKTTAEVRSCIREGARKLNERFLTA